MIPDLDSYQFVIVAFSGGKDSLACVLKLLDLGVDKSKIELWHHDIDGREGSKLMDWPATRDYCRKVAAALEIPIYYSWKEGGFEREMLRSGTPTAPNKFEAKRMFDLLGGVKTTGGEGPPGTRLKFPQVSPDLSVRWCSAYLKIDVGAAALRNQLRFQGARTLFVTGERAAESSARSRYKEFEPDRSDLREGRKPRHVDHWRPWLRRELGTLATITTPSGQVREGATFSPAQKRQAEQEIWDIIAKYHVNPHPAYRLGWGRLSCAACIFGSADQWASLRVVNPEQFNRIAAYEQEFHTTIKRKGSVVELADSGTPYRNMDPAVIRSALSDVFTEPVFIDPWTMPAGAFGDAAGPE